MMRLGSFTTGVLALAALEVVTSSQGASERTAKLPTLAAGVARRLLDPNIALLPNWHDTSAPLHTTGDGAVAPTFDVSSAGPGDPGHTTAGVRPPIVAPPPTSAADVLRQSHGG